MLRFTFWWDILTSSQTLHPINLWLGNFQWVFTALWTKSQLFNLAFKDLHNLTQSACLPLSPGEPSILAVMGSSLSPPRLHPFVSPYLGPRRVSWTLQSTAVLLFLGPRPFFCLLALLDCVSVLQARAQLSNKNAVSSSDRLAPSGSSLHWICSIHLPRIALIDFTDKYLLVWNEEGETKWKEPRRPKSFPPKFRSQMT